MNKEPLHTAKFRTGAKPERVYDILKESKKPSQTIHLWARTVDTGELYSTMWKDLQEQRCNPRTAVTLLHRHYSQIRVTPQKDWVSYGITIHEVSGDAKAEGGAFDMMNLQVKEEGTPAKGDSYPKGGEEGILIMTAVAFRMSYASTEGDYQERLWKTGLAVAKTKGLDTTSIQAKVSDQSCGLDPSLEIVLGCLDMFYTRYPKAEGNLIKTGSLILGYKDCSVLAEIEDIVTLLEIEHEDLAGWLLHARLVEEYASIYDPKEELEDPTSYYSYQSSLRITAKSFSSVKENPSLHLWSGIVGTLFLSKRFHDTKKIGSASTKTASAAFLTAYAFSTVVELKLGAVKNEADIDRANEANEMIIPRLENFVTKDGLNDMFGEDDPTSDGTSEEEKEEEEEEDFKDPNPGLETPTNTDPIDWLRWWRCVARCKATDEMIEWKTSSVKGPYRAGSVGEYFMNLVIPQ